MAVVDDEVKSAEQEPGVSFGMLLDLGHCQDFAG